MIETIKVNKALTLLSKGGTEYSYFFSKLSDTDWVLALHQLGFFKDPPPVLKNDDGDVVGASWWPESQCLARLAPINPEYITKLICEIKTDNYFVIKDFVSAALEVPLKYSFKISKYLLRWLREGNETRSLIEEDLAKLAIKLSEGGETSMALRLMEEILNVMPDPEAEAKRQEPETDDAFGLLNRIPKPWVRCDPYHYKEILDHQVPVLLRAAPLETVEMLSRLLLKAVEYSQREPDKTKPHDLFHISRNAIEDEKMHGDYDFEQNLISALRDACEMFCRRNSNRVAEIVSMLQSKEWFLFQRITLHLLHAVEEAPHQLVREKLVNRDLFESHYTWHEYYMLLQKRFGELVEKDQVEILSWIRDAEQQKASIKEYNAEASQDQKDKWVRYWQYEHLSAIESYLTGDWLDFFRSLQSEFGEPDMPFGYASWSGAGTYEPKTPKSADELADLTNTEIIDFLKTWTPPQDRFGPSPSSLSAALGTLVEREPDRFLSDLSAFLNAGLDRTYLRGLMSGLCRAVLADRPDLAELVLDFCSNLMNGQVNFRDLDLPARVRDGFDADDGWQPTRSAMIGFVEDLCDSKREIPFGLREKIWAVIEPMTRAGDPDLEYESKHMDESWDVMTASLNTMRGKALHAMMAYAMWVARHVKAQNPDRRPSFDVMAEVRGVLESRLDINEPFGQRQVDRAVIGRWLPQLVALNEAWVIGHFPDLFPSDPAYRHLRLACFATNILYVGRLYEKLIPIYLEEVELLAGKEIGEKESRSYEHRLAEHVVLLYAWEKVGLESGSLVDRFFRVAPSALRAHAMGFLGRDMHRKQDEPVSPEVQNRLKVLWNWRMELCGGLASMPHEELKAFGYWFAWGEFDAEWSLSILKAVIQGPGLGHANSYVFERVAEIFDECPKECLNVTEQFVETNTDQWFFVGTRKKEGIWNLLEKALQNSDADIQSHARAIVNLIGSKGHLEFRELLKEPNG